MEIYYVAYYLTLAALVSGGVYLSETLRSSVEKRVFARLFLLVAILAFALDGYLRGDRGRDTLGYRAHFEWVRDFADGWVLPTGIYKFEIGYSYLVLLLSKVGLSFEVFQFFLATGSIFLLIRIAKLADASPSRLLLAVIFSGFLFFSYNGTRQWLALLLFYFSLASRASPHPLAAVGAAAAFGMHRTIVVPIALWIFARASLVPSRLRRVIAAATVVVVLVVVATNTDAVLAGLGVERGGISELFDLNGMVGFGWLLQMAINLLSLILIYIRRKQLGVLEVFCMIWIVMYALFAYNRDIMRLAMYFGFAQIVVLSRRSIGNGHSVYALIWPTYVMLATVGFVASIYMNSHGILDTVEQF